MLKETPKVRGYELIKLRRKTISISIKPDGTLLVKAPIGVSKGNIDRIVLGKEGWIQKQYEKLSEAYENQKNIVLNKNQVKEYKKNGKIFFASRCKYFSEIMGVTYGKIKVNGAKTRWGSCNSNGDLNFTYRLLFADDDLIDYVVVHELAHRKQMNHSKEFWKVVEEVLPDYKEREKRLFNFKYEYKITEDLS